MILLKKILLAIPFAFTLLQALPATALADADQPLKELVDKVCANTSFRNSLQIRQDKLMAYFVGSILENTLILNG